jgi:hypothetical protein
MPIDRAALVAGCIRLASGISFLGDRNDLFAGAVGEFLARHAEDR